MAYIANGAMIFRIKEFMIFEIATDKNIRTGFYPILE